ncbi:MAG: hypothetical protein WBF66_00965 [Dehalococcoidia bacterium]
MTQRIVAILALATLIALTSTALTTTSRAQDAQRTVNLSPGCNMTTLTFADGTDTATVAAAVSPPDALDTIWRLDNATGTFQAFTPKAPQASDLTSLNLLDAVFICVDAAADITMPTVSPEPSGTPISTPLSTGCNALGLTYPDGTAPSHVADAVTPAGACESMWRYDATQGSFQAYVAAASQASDLTSLQFLDAVFLCTTGPGSVTMPAVSEPGPEVVTEPPRDVRYVMEAAVPQVVDLPSGFVAVGENFWSGGPWPGVGAGLDPPGLLYYYEIYYGSILSLIGAPMETMVFFSPDLALFDTVDHAKSAMNEFTSASAEDLKAALEPVFGGSLGLEIGSLTIQEVEPVAGLGEEAHFIRVRMQVRRVHSNDFFVPMAEDIITLRRDRVVGRVWVGWSPGPPGPNFIPENLAEKMDAGIQEALPELLAAVP